MYSTTSKKAKFKAYLHTPKTPYSSSVFFDSKEDYDHKINIDGEIRTLRRQPRFIVDIIESEGGSVINVPKPYNESKSIFGGIDVVIREGIPPDAKNQKELHIFIKVWADSSDELSDKIECVRNEAIRKGIETVYCDWQRS